jgi:sortase (surface protein transpeptidase)
VLLALIAGLALVIWGTLRLTVLDAGASDYTDRFPPLTTTLPGGSTSGNGLDSGTDGAGRGTTTKGPPPANPLDFGRQITPARLVIPEIGVNAAVGKMGLDSTGALEVPKSWTDTGWYGSGPAPGQTGPAVIVGHYDSTTGPAVFYRVPSLKAGQKIDVKLADGRTLEFTVDSLEMVSKDIFPTDQVYGQTARPELRLITCGGSFNSTTHHYLDNIIVYAHLTTPLGWLMPPAPPPKPVTIVAAAPATKPAGPLGGGPGAPTPATKPTDPSPA